MTRAAEIGVFGGSGFYAFLDDVTTVEISTPYGDPASPVSVGTVGDRRVAFIARHGTSHQHPPHRLPYRANLWAMRELGVGAIFAPCAVGSLRASIEPGDFVVCDQLVDRTSGREDTFHDGPDVQHVSFADPYCNDLRRAAIESARAEGVTVHDEGTIVVIQGPRFSTRAESRWFRAMGWHVVGMTQYPEAVLAAELGIRYATIALVTDYDAGVDGLDHIEPVTQEAVYAMVERNVDTVRRVLFRAIESLDPDRPPDG